MQSPRGLLQFVESNEGNNANWARIRTSRSGMTVVAQGAGP